MNPYAAALLRRLLAYISAMLASALAVGPTVFLLVVADERGGESPSLADVARFSMLTALFITVWLALPSALLIYLAERKRIRRLWSYAVTGALIFGSFLLLMVPTDQSLVAALAAFPATYSVLAAVLLASGAACGAVYWVLAGRYAGNMQSN